MSIKHGDINIPENLPVVRRGDSVVQKVCRGDVETWNNGVETYVWTRAAGDDHAADSLLAVQTAPTIIEGFVAPHNMPLNRMFPMVGLSRQMQAIIRVEGFNSINWIDTASRSINPGLKTAPAGGTIANLPAGTAVDQGGGRRGLSTYAAEYLSYMYVTGEYADDFYFVAAIYTAIAPAIPSGADMRISPDARVSFIPIVLDAVLLHDQVLTTTGVGRYIDFVPLEISGWTYAGLGNYYVLRSSGTGGGTSYVIGLMYIDITFMPSVTGTYSMNIAGVNYSMTLTAGVPLILKDFAIGFTEATSNMGMFHANAVPAGGSVTVKAGARMRHGRDARVYIQRLLDFSLASATVNTAFTITGWIPDNMRLSMLWRVNRHRVKGNVVIEWTGNAGANSIAIFFVGSTNMYANDAALGRGLPAANVTSLGAGRYRADIPFYTFFTTLQGPAYNPVTIRGQFLTGGSTTITNVLVRKESWFEIIHTMVEAYLPTDTVVTVNQRIRGWKPTALSEWGFTDDTFITPPNYGPPAQDPYAIYSSVLLTFICSKSGNHTIQFRSTDRVKTAVGSITFSPTAVGDGTYSYTWSGSISYAGKIVAGEPLEFYFSTIPLSGTVIVKAGSKIN